MQLKVQDVGVFFLSGDGIPCEVDTILLQWEEKLKYADE